MELLQTVLTKKHMYKTDKSASRNKTVLNVKYNVRPCGIYSSTDTWRAF